MSPVTARPGDTLKIIATADNCPTDLNAKGWLTKDSLGISGSDVVLTYLQNDDCSVTVSAVVAAKPINREVTLNVNGTEPNADPKKTVSLGHTTFRIVDSAAIPPSPIPPGLKPQVDVMWNIMSEKMCADEFGVRLAKYYYCIDVTLGNNSGYPLILAAVGFLRHVNGTEYRDSTASYLSTRSTVQQGQVLSARAFTVAGLQAAGAIIAGTTALSSKSARKGRLAIWSTLVGTVAAGVAGGIIPDHTIKEDTALDDAALRDGRLIPNNSPVRFAVFVDREAISPLLLRDDNQLLRDADAAKTRAEESEKRINAEKDPIELELLRQEIKKWREWEREMRIEAAAHAKPNYTKLKGNRMNPLKNRQPILSGNLISVRRALGNLIIVGDQIQYLQRVQVDTSAVVPGIEPTPVVTGQSGTITQGTAGDITLLGTGLAKANRITAIMCASNITGAINAQPDSSGTSVILKGFLVTGCTESAIPLLVSNGSASFIYNLAITAAPLLNTPATATVTADAANKAIFHLKGKSLAGAKATVTLTNGTNTDTPAATTVNGSDTDLDVTVTLDGNYLNPGTTAKVKVSTDAGGTSNELSFTLQAPPILDDPQKAPNPAHAAAVTLAVTGVRLKGATASVTLSKAGQPDLTLPAANVTLTPDATTSDKAFALAIKSIDAKYATAGTTITLTVSTPNGKSNSVAFRMQ